MEIKELILQDESILYIGETKDIKAMYKSIARNQNTMIRPFYSDMPIFSELKQIYGLNIDRENWMTIINSDTCLDILLQEGHIQTHDK